MPSFASPASSPLFANLSAGTYTIGIIDRFGCSAERTVTIDDPNIYESAGGLWVDTIEHGPMPASRWYRLMR